MALSKTTIWEVRSGGSATNGSGAFDPGQTAGMFTDGAATSATGSTPNFTSASYNFVTGDTGAWLFIGSGTNWTPGWYKITWDSGTGANLSAAVGAAVTAQASLRPQGPSTVAGCATTASPTGATWSIDYSQQNSSQITYDAVNNALTSAGANSTTVFTAGVAPIPFGKQMVGNSIVVQSGTNFTTGRYVVASVDGSNIATVLGPTTITGAGGAGAAGVGRLGGALAAISNNSGAVSVSGNYTYITGTFASNGETENMNGSTTSPSKIIGYKTVRGDGYLGRANSGLGSLITTNFAVINLSSSNRLTLQGTGSVECLSANSDINSSSGAVSCQQTLARWCAFTNTGTGSSGTQACGLSGNLIDCDLSATGSTGGNTSVGVLGASSAGLLVFGCRVNCANATSPCISTDTTCQFLCNAIYASLGVGLKTTSTNGNPLIAFNTFAGCNGDEISLIASSTAVPRILCNMITDSSGGYGINMNNVNVFAIVMYNRFRDLFSGNTNLGTEGFALIDYGNVTTDTGGPETDYTSAGTPNFDYSLIPSSPGTSAAIPKSASMGAYQRAQNIATGGGGTFISRQAVNRAGMY